MGHHEKKKIHAHSIYYYNFWTHKYDIILYKVTETVATVVMCLYWSYRVHRILYTVLYVRITIIMHSIVFKTRFSHFTRSAYPEMSVVVLSENTNIYVIILKHGTHACRIFADFRYITSRRSHSLCFIRTLVCNGMFIYHIRTRV